MREAKGQGGRRARLNHDWGKCADCGEPVIKARAVQLNGELYHPLKCAAKAIEAIGEAAARVRRLLGGAA